MTRFEWNGLRVGDPVVVHNPRASVPGVGIRGEVAFVHPRSGRTDNQVGVRCSPPSDGDVMWPGRLQVHLPTEGHACPWCAMVN
jgi:hypothetical protein